MSNNQLMGRRRREKNGFKFAKPKLRESYCQYKYEYWECAADEF